MNPVDAALAKKKVTMSVDTTECKYFGKLYHTGKKLMEHINQVSKLSMLVHSVLNYLISIHSICSTPQALQDHMKENHEANPGAVERQCSLCEFTSDSISKLAEHNQSVHHPYGCNICFLHFSAEYKLEDHRLAEHKISFLGTSVDVVDQGHQPPELPEPGDVGIPHQEPSRMKGNQLPKPPTPLKEPSSKEPKVLAGSENPQVEIDEVKGSEVGTEEYDRECEACNHFFSGNMYRRSHITRYHKALLR